MADDDMQRCTRRARVRMLVVGSRGVRQIHTTVYNIAYKLGDVVSLSTSFDFMLKDSGDGDVRLAPIVGGLFFFLGIV